MFTTFARAEIDGKDRHIALILEKGMKGFEVGERFDTMGLRGNDLRRLYFNDVRVPPENVLGEPGEGFRIAMQILNNGRIGLGTGSVGATKGLLDRTIEHVKERRQFGQPLADFELVEEKIGWMVSYLFGLESLCYLTCGLVDAGVPDYSLESAICKVSGTEFLWYAANRALQLKGGAGYMRDEPYEKILRDIRIFPIFEGANDVLRAFIALSGIKPVGEQLSDLGGLELTDPIGSIGVLADYVSGRIRPDKITLAHPELSTQAEAVSDQVKELRSVTESLLREHKKGIIERQFHQKRLADAVSDIYGQIAVLSRISSIFEDQGVEPSGQERYIAETFCNRAAGRVRSQFRPDRVERRRAHERDRQARLQARLLRLRAVRGLSARTRPRSAGRKAAPDHELLSGAEVGGRVEPVDRVAGELDAADPGRGRDRALLRLRVLLALEDDDDRRLVEVALGDVEAFVSGVDADQLGVVGGRIEAGVAEAGRDVVDARRPRGAAGPRRAGGAGRRRGRRRSRGRRLVVTAARGEQHCAGQQRDARGAGRTRCDVG